MEDSKESAPALVVTSSHGPHGTAANYWLDPETGTTVAVPRTSGSGTSIFCWFRRGPKLQGPSASQGAEPSQELEFQLFVGGEVHRGRTQAELDRTFARVVASRRAA